jgi:hypothetical protein
LLKVGISAGSISRRAGHIAWMLISPPGMSVTFTPASVRQRCSAATFMITLDMRLGIVGIRCGVQKICV